MRVRKNRKVHFAKGFAWSFDEHGNRIAINSLNEALEHEAKCCGINCCENTITIGINDASSDAEYPATLQLVKVGTDIILRVSTDFGSGPVTGELTFV